MLWVLTLISVLAGCSNEATDHRPVISVSVDPQRFLLERLAGNRIKINVLLPKGTDPEAFDPSVSAMRDLEHSDLYLPIGSFPFEQLLRTRISQTNPDLPVVMPEGITVLGGHHCAHHHEEERHCTYHDECNHHHDGHDGSADPHVWTSVANLRAMAAQMYRQVVDIDPAGRDQYNRRYSDLCTELDSLDAHLIRTLAPLHGQSFLIWHPSLSYFANDYGLTQITVQTDGKEPTPAQLSALITEATHGNVPLLIVNEAEHNPRLMNAINADLRLPQLNISLMQGDLFKTLITLSDALRSSYNP